MREWYGRPAVLCGFERPSAAQFHTEASRRRCYTPGVAWMQVDPLERFSPATRRWFAATFDAPTAAQAEGWPAISAGEHTLILAPTGSGKTLAAFLWTLDRLLSEPSPDEKAALPGPLRLAAQGAGLRRRAQPAGPAHRHRYGGPVGRRAGCASASAPATRPSASGATSSATRPTSSSPPPSRST